MHLTKEEERILEGEEGNAAAKSMKILAALGDIYGAEKLIPVGSVQIAGVSYANLGDAGLEIAFTQVAVVLAQTFVSLPFLVIALEGAARTAGSDYDLVAATLGARPGTVLWRVTLPLLAPGVVSGAVLAFARSLGEFGATLTFAGSRQGVTRTLPLEIYLQRESDPDAAVALSILLVAVAAVVVLGLGARRMSGWNAS